MSPPTPSTSTSSSNSSSSGFSPPPPPPQSTTLIPPSSQKRHNKHHRFRVFRSVFRSLPIFSPPVVCKFPTLVSNPLPDVKSGARVTGTLFGYRRGHVSLSIQETSRCLPTTVIELAMQTSALQREMTLGTVRVALECDKRNGNKDRTRVLEEPLWTMYCNGKKSGYGVRREANEEDLKVMEQLKAVSMGAGVFPGTSDVEGPDGELAYMRAYFERVVGSRDSETYYVLSPEGNNGLELSVFFVRV